MCCSDAVYNVTPCYVTSYRLLSCQPEVPVWGQAYRKRDISVIREIHYYKLKFENVVLGAV